MEKCVLLVHITIFGVKYFWVSGIDDILDDMSVLVHFYLNVLVELVLGSILISLDSVDAHHILLANLIKTLSHLDKHLLVFLESLDLHKLDIFERTARWLTPLRIQQLGQQWIGGQFLTHDLFHFHPWDSKT